MNRLSSLLFCVVLILTATAGFTQYQPDTSLTYAEFLKQCQNFSRQQREEMWVVNFWASWNGNSLYTLPGLKNLHANFNNKPIRFVSISVDKVRSNWEKRLPEYQLPWEQLLVEKESNYSFLKKAFKHNSLPGIFLVDQGGQIQRVRDIQELQGILTMESRSLPDRPYYANNLSEEIIDLTPVVDDEPTTVEDLEPEIEDDPITSNENQGWVTHTVRKGNTLFSLYRQYGVKVDEIRSLNGLKGNEIFVGQVLKIKRR